MKTKEKKKRRLLGGSEDPLEFSGIEPGYHYHVFNDDPQRPGRIARAEEAGYEVVYSDKEMGVGGVNAPSKLGGAVTVPGGPGVTGVLMRKPLKDYQEDQKEKQKREVDASEAAIKRHSRNPGRYGKIDIGKMTED